MTLSPLAAAKLLSPDGRHRLLNDTVFQFNDQYRRFWQRFWRRSAKSLGTVDGEGLALIVPAMYDKASRTFNWIALSDPVLGHSFHAHGEERQEARTIRRNALAQLLHGMRENFRNADEKWRDFAKRFSDSPHANAALNCIEGYIRVHDMSQEKLTETLEGDELTKVWIAAATLYSSYSHPRDQHLEGLFYKVLECFGARHPELVGSPVFGLLTKDSEINLAEWRNQWKIPQHADGLGLLEDPWDGFAPRAMEKAGYSDKRIWESKVTEESLLGPLWVDSPITESEPTKRFRDLLNEFNLVMLQPLYDVWIGNDGFGSLQGVLLLFLRPDESGVGGRIGKPSFEGHYNILLEGCDEFARDVSQTSIQRALATPITPPYDLVRHFLHILKEVQDWQEATVFYGDTASYCFSREKHEGRPLPVRTYWEERPAAQYGPTVQAGGMIEDGDRFYMWWTREEHIPAADGSERAFYNLWSRNFLVDLTDDERLMFQDTSIRFEFPRACRIPPDEASRCLLVETYLRQQLELMRVLIPKVRARRAALRNAVSAIMGRNMSHNIGSHVLARYASHVGVTVSDEGPDPRSDFLLYLQRRMDFLAEVATSDRSLFALPLVLKDQLEKLNLDAQRTRYRYDPPIPSGGLPLLQNITGKHSLDATVVFEPCGCYGAESRMFACPGGEVGVHALYVILENIIRNSARHSGAEASGPSQQELKILVRPKCRKCAYPGGHGEPDEARHDLIEVRIIDPRTRLGTDGIHLPLREDGRDQRACDDAAGETAKAGPSEPLPEHINGIIRGQPVIEEDGRPNPHHWGLREMQICAQYLRQLPLSDLEDSNLAADKAPLIRAESIEFDGAHCLCYVIYLQEARLLALLLNDTDGSTVSTEALPLGVRIKIRQDESGEKHCLALRSLPDLGSYSFVAYSSDLDQWVQDCRGKLPVHLVKLPARIENSCLDASAIVDEFRDSPIRGLELLHESYARQASGSQLPVGLVVAKGEGVSLPNGITGRVCVRSVCTANLADALGDWFRDHEHDRLSIWVDHLGLGDMAGVYAMRPDGASAKNLISLEPCFSGSATSLAVSRLADGQSWELLAASLSRILVLDERVQAGAGEAVRDGLNFGKCWEAMHIRVPPANACNLDHPNYLAISEYLKTIKDDAIDFVILHLTILERLSAQLSERSIFAALAYLFSAPRFERSYFIIITGRGVPAFAQAIDKSGVGLDLPIARRTRFVAVSAILEYITRYPSKVGVMRVIWGISGMGI